MKVAMLGPIAWRTPPAHYGPWERVTSLLTEGLVRRGVDVTLFATADSQTAARLEAVAPHGYAEDPSMDGRVWEALHVAHAIDRSGEFDLDAQPARLAAPRLRRPVGRADGDHDPRLLRSRNPAGVRAQHVGVRVDLGRRPLAGAELPRRRSTMAST